VHDDDRRHVLRELRVLWGRHVRVRLVLRLFDGPRELPGEMRDDDDDRGRGA
jgi:hypothetical protein